MLLSLVCCCGPSRTPAGGGGGAAACIWVRETERAQGGPRACVGPRGMRSVMGAGRRRGTHYRSMLASHIGRPSASKSVKEKIYMNCKLNAHVSFVSHS
jgi:hypothetical protein